MNAPGDGKVISVPVVNQGLTYHHFFTLFQVLELIIDANIGDAWKALLDLATNIPDYDQEAVVSLTNFFDQLPSVLNQVIGAA